MVTWHRYILGSNLVKIYQKLLPVSKKLRTDKQTNTHTDKQTVRRTYLPKLKILASNDQPTYLPKCKFWQVTNTTNEHTCQNFWQVTNRQTNILAKNCNFWQVMKGQSEIAYLPKFANMMLIVMVIVITEILYIILIFDCFRKINRIACTGWWC